MNAHNTFQSLVYASSSLAARAGRLLSKWMGISEANPAASTISVVTLAPACATGFGGQDGGSELASCRVIMIDIRGANP